MNELNIRYDEFDAKVNYANTLKQPINIIKILNYLKKIYSLNKKNPKIKLQTLKKFYESVLGKNINNNFVLTNEYYDYEKADIYDKLYNYGIEDNSSGWTGLRIHFKDIIDKLYNLIGKKHFKFSNNVVKIETLNNKPNVYKIITEKEINYLTNKKIII